MYVSEVSCIYFFELHIFKWAILNPLFGHVGFLKGFFLESSLEHMSACWSVFLQSVWGGVKERDDGDYLFELEVTSHSWLV